MPSLDHLTPSPFVCFPQTVQDATRVPSSGALAVSPGFGGGAGSGHTLAGLASPPPAATVIRCVISVEWVCC